MGLTMDIVSHRPQAWVSLSVRKQLDSRRHVKHCREMPTWDLSG